jgi:hypothetical protein
MRPPRSVTEQTLGRPTITQNSADVENFFSKSRGSIFKGVEKWFRFLAVVWGCGLLKGLFPATPVFSSGPNAQFAFWFYRFVEVVFLMRRFCIRQIVICSVGAQAVRWLWQTIHTNLLLAATQLYRTSSPAGHPSSSSFSLFLPSLTIT